MQPEARMYLHDMQRAALLLRQFTEGKTHADYQSDALLRSAVERQFEIIGEALSRLSKIDMDAAAAITDRRRIIDFRNLLIHGYAVVSDSVVWGIVETNLPVLFREIDQLLSSK